MELQQLVSFVHYVYYHHFLLLLLLLLLHGRLQKLTHT